LNKAIKDKTPILSITKADFIIQTFRSGGKGGQNQNKIESGVRIIHKVTGIRAESREERSQVQNKRIAFKRLCDNAGFKKWLNYQALHKIAQIDSTGSSATAKNIVEREVDKSLSNLNNLKFEIKSNGEWQEVSTEFFDKNKGAVE
jgi:hypothetical protein